VFRKVPLTSKSSGLAKGFAADLEVRPLTKVYELEWNPKLESSNLKQPNECLFCNNKTCEQMEEHKIDICAKGIAHFNDGKKIHKKNEHITLRYVAANLRHELNKVLQYIVSQADELGDSLSTKEINLNKPESRIIGATIILDNFIEMIAGVYDFTPDTTLSTASSSSPINLFGTIQRFVDTYSLIKSHQRAKNIQISIQVEKNIQISRLPSIIEYLIATFADNIWKYAKDGGPVKIVSFKNGAELLDLEFSNIGDKLPESESIFEKGYQLNANSEGFGFGLYWAKKLCEHYNQRSGRRNDFLELTHRQSPAQGAYIHTFSIKNISYENKK
jgi:K+-sensing histidine kinase KdpD